MFISRLFVRNFRNFRHLDVRLADGVTCFIGENNSGKTNLFQAIRLVLDGNLSAYRRRLQAEDLAAGLSFSQPEHVLVSVELSDFAGKTNEEALAFTAILKNQTARISYRFRPKGTIRNDIEQQEQAGQTHRSLTLDDYTWELAGGGDDCDLAAITWKDPLGTRFDADNLQQGFPIVLMDALRDVEARLASPRLSPLQQIVEQRNISDTERGALVTVMQDANDKIGASSTLETLGTELSEAFKSAAGRTYAMGVSLGLGEASFSDISRGLRVLLSGHGISKLDPARNGLGLNNILYISMLLSYFERRIAEKKTSGQLLLVEEPEAHLHPQLQRVLLAMLLQKKVQVFITTHSTHITSGVPLSSHVVLTCDGSAATTSVATCAIPGLSKTDIADLERYLDATRSALLYARKVLLVEGPAELFVIPALARSLWGLDFDEAGVAVVPIFGTHFGVYTKLFATDGIARKCAVVADGDLVPSDATGDAAVGDDEDAVIPPQEQALQGLNSANVKVFTSTTTFEREITQSKNLRMLAAACNELGAPKIAAALTSGATETDTGGSADLAALGMRVLRTARRIGKARFAQTVSKHAGKCGDMPAYIRDAIKWLTSDAPN